MIADLSDAAGRAVSRETTEMLRQFEALVHEGSASQNLVSRSTLENFWERHIIDAAQLVRHEARPRGSWVDIGSGAGVPGIVIACLVEGPVTLVEPRRLRVEFLTQAIRRLNLNSVVIRNRAERVSGKFDMITGRAVASLTNFLKLSHHLSTEKSRWVLPKGRNALAELDEAERAWQGVFHVEQSITDPDSSVVIAESVRKLGVR